MTGTAPGALLMLLLAVYLLLAFFTGRLDWLMGLGRDVRAGYDSGQAPTSQAPSVTQYPRRGYAA